jgi:hypothetical protein
MPLRDILLIGPTGVGKTTVGRLLADRLMMPLVSLDTIRFVYHKEMDYDEEYAAHLRRENYEALLRYWEPFNAHVVARALEDYPGSILDFGAIHSVYDDEVLAEKVARLLLPYPNVILLTPAPDPEESIQFLYERGVKGTNLSEATLLMWQRIIARFIEHPDNRRLARHTVYTREQTPEQIREAICEWLISPSVLSSLPQGTRNRSK